MDRTSNFSLPTLLSTPGNSSHHTPPPESQRWEFLVAVLATAVSVSVLLAVLAKCQVIRRYLASYRHTRLRDGDSVSQGDPSGHGVEFSMHGGRGGTHTASLLSTRRTTTASSRTTTSRAASGRRRSAPRGDSRTTAQFSSVQCSDSLGTWRTKTTRWTRSSSPSPKSFLRFKGQALS
ncbi:type III endosome membrane protein TEMP [Gadus macrocephalus]|uniref:type III endosome membrane protein TEMP n=1 Tax=Gadus macrocephalus TaxID=80720 RepID=UPI0028CB553B|nr:type III endosome membrane protein TEMP [Gadus macrocephalus]